MKAYFFLFLFVFVACGTQEGVQWKAFEEVDKLHSANPKKGVVLIYDDSCEDCIHAKEYVLTEPSIAAYINEHFYAMQLEIFEERNIQFNGKNWTSEASLQGPKYSTLAMALCQETDQVPTPTYAFLDERLNLIIPIKKNLSREDLKLLLKFIAEDKFKEMSIDQFREMFDGEL